MQSCFLFVVFTKAVGFKKNVNSNKFEVLVQTSSIFFKCLKVYFELTNSKPTRVLGSVI